MIEALLDTLSPHQRLALSYAPASSRMPVLALFALEQRLSAVVGGDGEPMIAQIKLAWWRDRLSEDASEWPAGEPLLELLAETSLAHCELVPLVDGFEALLSEAIDPAALEEFASGKAKAWQAVSKCSGEQPGGDLIGQAAKEVALFELSTRLSLESEISMAKDLVRQQPWQRARLSRTMRPLAVLHALAQRAMAGNKAGLLDGPAAMFTAMRVGITGR